LLHDTGGFAHPVEVVRERDPLAVLSGQRGNEVNVVVGVPDSDPSAPSVVVVGSKPHPVEHLASDLIPLLVSEQAISWRRPEGAVPDVPLRCPNQGERLLEQLAERSQPLRKSTWLQKIRSAIPSADGVWVLMLVRASWSVQVAEKPSDATASEDLPDHGPTAFLTADDASAYIN
jgi:hypothetical protein